MGTISALLRRVGTLLILPAALGLPAGCNRPQGGNSTARESAKDSPAVDPAQAAAIAQARAQAEWERRLRDESGRLAEANKTGNGLVIAEAQKKYDAFAAEAFRPGRSLDGWLGIAGNVSLKEGTARDGAGKEHPLVELSFALCDLGAGASNAVHAFTLTNYDPATGRGTGLVDVLRAHQGGTLARVSGTLREEKVGEFTRQVVALSRFEPADLAGERKAQLDLLDEVRRRAVQAVGQHGKLADPEAVHRPAHVGANFYARVAATYPDYPPAVRGIRGYAPDPVVAELGCEKSPLLALRERLTTVRLLDPRAEAAEMPAQRERVARAEAALRKLAQDLETVNAVLDRARTAVLRGATREQEDEFAFAPAVAAAPRGEVAQIRLVPDVEVGGADVSLALDGRRLKAGQLDSPLELSRGGHELIVRRGTLARRYAFQVGAGTGSELRLACEGWVSAPVEDAPKKESRPEDVGPEKGFTALLNGKDLTGWKTVDYRGRPDTGHWKVEDGQLVSTSQTRGRVFVEREYSDYHLRVVAYTTPGARGELLIRAADALKPSGADRQHFKVLLHNTGQDERTGTFQRSSGSTVTVKTIRQALAADNEWFVVEVIARGTRVEVKVNGETVAETVDEVPARLRAFHIPILRGAIGFDAWGEGSLHIKRVDIKELK